MTRNKNEIAKPSISKQKWVWLGGLGAIVIGIILLGLIQLAFQRGWTTYTITNSTNSDLFDDDVTALAIDGQSRVG